ncbi:MAG: Cobalamin biosynthesis protein [Verrucomicrobiales bacterium]|nr:Cobalamin biosynthesis protein [Verrucomicrobiales bacterium]
MIRSDLQKMKPRYIMIGGFLGAGKTTAVAALAKHLTDEGQRVGLITNDQGSNLVDTAMLRSRGFATEEIVGGCFCCRFNSLTDAAKKLTNETRPDVFIAEPVGSCTDLVATVTYPLRRIYGDDFQIAPLSVLIDPIRALRIFGLEQGGKFSDKVLYIFRKQLAEADAIVLNKIDLLSPEQIERLEKVFARDFPHATLFKISARKGEGLLPWFSHLQTELQQTRPAVSIDYDIYAEGEALLGWLNCTVELSHSEGADTSAVLKGLATIIHDELRNNQSEIGHLKMTLSPDVGFGDVAVINLVRNDYVPELSQTLEETVRTAQIIINLRAEAAPESLRDTILKAIEGAQKNIPGLRLTLEHLEYFRPGRPTPTHRLLTPAHE